MLIFLLFLAMVLGMCGVNATCYKIVKGCQTTYQFLTVDPSSVEGTTTKVDGSMCGGACYKIDKLNNQTTYQYLSVNPSGMGGTATKVDDSMCGGACYMITKGCQTTYQDLSSDPSGMGGTATKVVDSYCNIETPCPELSEDKEACEHNSFYSCVWNVTEYGGYCNVDKLQYVKCGDTYDIPKQVPAIISFIVNFLKIITPIVLIIVGIITLVKTMAASKDDEITKAKNSLLRKVIAAVMVFLVITIVQFVILKVADSSKHDSINSCLSCFLNNKCGSNIYYKANIYGTDKCYYLEGTEIECGNK